MKMVASRDHGGVSAWKGLQNIEKQLGFHECLDLQIPNSGII